ncbi:MAG: CPBP family intramembrane metalloprotease [Bacteroidetes bacterium]|nr:CPBP family intramembrane metalloprotease [Bacteroidota bacterium]
MIISTKRRTFEILAVILTGLGKFLFMDLLNQRLGYILTACFFWGIYIFIRAKQDVNILDYWGLNLKNFKRTFIELLPFAVVLALLFIIIGFGLKTSVLNVRIIPILLIYPIWGIIQQFIMIGILARNLKDSQKVNLTDFWIVFLTAVVFAIVHFPFLLLVISTFALALVYTKLYLNDRNLIVLGIYHGLLGALFFYTLLGRDPFLEVFG